MLKQNAPLLWIPEDINQGKTVIDRGVERHTNKKRHMHRKKKKQKERKTNGELEKREGTRKRK